MKKIISACLKQIVEFDTNRELDIYLKKIIGEYEILKQTTLPNGKIQIVIIKSYNNTPLLRG